MNIYEIGYNGYWTGNTRVISDNQGAPAGWTRSPVPTLADGQYALWSNTWVITTIAPNIINQIFDDGTLLYVDKMSIINAATRLIQTQRIIVQLVYRGQI